MIKKALMTKTIYSILLIAISFLETIDAQQIELKTDNLYNAEFLDYMYKGHFENINLKRKDLFFSEIVALYLRTYGSQCSNYLPANKVKIMEQQCVAESVTTNGLGVEVGRTCAQYKWVWTGLYARPDLYDAKLKMEETLKSRRLGDILSIATDPNAIGNTVDLAHKARGLRLDMSKLFKINACDGKAIRRFEENLKLFMLNKPGIRSNKTSKYEEIKKSGGPRGKQNLTKLINDLITDQAKTWSFNRYINGSISRVNILSNDAQGRPKSVKANYRFSGFGRSNGWVKIDFANGLPKCIYFWDFPRNCKTSSSTIVNAYAQGNYSTQ